MRLSLPGLTGLFLAVCAWAFGGFTLVRGASVEPQEMPELEAAPVCQTVGEVAVGVMRDLQVNRLTGSIVPIYFADGSLALQLMIAGVPWGVQLIFVEGCYIGERVVTF